METLRTPDERFADLPGYPFAPHYVERRRRCASTTSTRGRATRRPVLLLHGEPSWSYLYRKMIPVLAAAGLRVRRARPRRLRPLRQAGARASDYTYQRHVDWMRGVARRARPPRRHARLPGLGRAHRPAPRRRAPGALRARRRRQHVPADRRHDRRARRSSPGSSSRRRRPSFHVGGIVQRRLRDRRSPPEVVAAYDAPFPDDTLQGRRAPVPDAGADVARRSGGGREPRARGRCCARWTKPFLTAFCDSDPITARRRRASSRSAIPGAQGQPHTTIDGRRPLPPGGQGRGAGARRRRLHPPHVARRAPLALDPPRRLLQQAPIWRRQPRRPATA